ncbi:MAG TPA: NHLP bacteriocin system secretion protein [Desulfitobacterium dehalogenans]|uniref:NHLP bacteriocin system secretion protein n=1 Tax=Desulfitobacterium dehalogenans TaxID=36854 RepID=A0A7C7D7B4_9FIRM|nr:NHLP bacteriocin system secretion protein [Desulfitobacterium dehalogenans]
MRQGLFRDVSLTRLSSPEQLDQRIQVTSPKAWLALLAIGLILMSGVAWGLLGSIPTKIQGQGILLNNGGVFSLQHQASGQVSDIRVKAGQEVRQGDVVARIEQPELVAQIRGLLSSRADLNKNSQGEDPDLAGIEEQIQQLRSELIYRTQVVSEVDGRILELNMSKGSIVKPGDTLATLEQYGGTVKLEAVVYVPAEQGGLLRPGMECQISPTTVNKEEYGYLLGRVNTVAEYPATAQSMMQTLGNESLVTFLAGQGAPLLVKIDLVPDSATESGYRWSSPLGPPMSFQSGAIITTEIITQREKPIQKVIPF